MHAIKILKIYCKDKLNIIFNEIQYFILFLQNKNIIYCQYFLLPK